MTDELNTTLDYIDNIVVNGNPFAEPANEYYALLCLRAGLNLLYSQALKCDKIVLERLDPSKMFMIYGGDPRLTGIPIELLTCFFTGTRYLLANMSEQLELLLAAKIIPIRNHWNMLRLLFQKF